MATMVVAETDARIAQSLIETLEAEDHQVIWVMDGQEAYQRTLTEKADLVFLDVNLPIFDGLETCSMLRDDPDVPRTLPIILLTALDIDARTVENVQATRVLSVPFLAQDLRDVLVDYLGGDALRQA